jgi:MSHA biogenesis protein MshQ
MSRTRVGRWWRAATACGLLLLTCAPVVAQTYLNASTPYAFIDSSTHTKIGANTAPYKFVQASGCGTTPPVIDDTLAGPIPIGFNFVYGTTTWTQLYVMTNGRVQFGNTTCGSGTQSVGPPQTYPYPYPNTSMNNTMKVFGVDLDPTNLVERPNYPSSTNRTPCTDLNNCYVSVATIGTAPSRQFVVTWKNVPEWVTSTNTSGNFDLQVILNEDGTFVYQYGDIIHGGTGTAQIGWQLSSTDFQVISFGASQEPPPNTAIKFFRPLPIAQFYFDEAAWARGLGGQVKDSGSTLLHGTALGRAQTTANGRVCRAADIPANTSASVVDAVQTGLSLNNSSLNLQGTGTIAFWYRSNLAWSGAGATDVQLMDASGPSGAWFYLSKRANGSLVFTVRDSTGTARSVTSPAQSIAANTWTHVAVTWNFNGLSGSNQDQLQVFINAATPTTASFTSSGTLNAAIGLLSFGDNPLGVADTNGSVNSANGLIDEAYVYNYVLSTAQMSTVLNLTHACQSYAIDHLEILYSGGSALTCEPVTVTLRACANAACSSLYTGGLTGAFSSTGSVTPVWDSATGYADGNAFVIPNGLSAVTKTLQLVTAGNARLGASASFPAPTGATTCNFGSPSCTLTSQAAALTLSVPAHVAETAQTLRISAGAGTACSAGWGARTRNVQLRCSYLNPASGSLPVRLNGRALNAGNNAALACDGTGQSLALTFDAAGQATLPLLYADAGQVRLDATYTGSDATADTGLTLVGATSFVAAPADFAFDQLSAGAQVAGVAFQARATARNAVGARTTNFGNESSTAPLSWSVLRRQPLGAGTSDGVLTGGAVASNGLALATNLVWSEVGQIDLQVSTSNYLASGLNVVGSTGTAGALGPFRPHHLWVQAQAGCGTTFTYGGQPFASATVTARNALAITTLNYTGAFAKAVSFSDANAAVGLSFTNGSWPASQFSNGVGSATNLTPALANKESGPFASVRLRATDADGVSSAAAPSEPVLSVKSGRLALQSAVGSSSRTLDLPVRLETWSGKAWVLETGDTCTSLSSAQVALSGYANLNPSAAAWTTSVVSASLTPSNGTGLVRLAAPTPTGSAGTVAVALNLGGASTDQACLATPRPSSTGANRAWLRSRWGSAGAGIACSGAWVSDPSAKASFGAATLESQKRVHERQLY